MLLIVAALLGIAAGLTLTAWSLIPLTVLVVFAAVLAELAGGAGFGTTVQSCLAAVISFQFSYCIGVVGRRLGTISLGGAQTPKAWHRY